MKIKTIKNGIDLSQQSATKIKILKIKKEKTIISNKKTDNQLDLINYLRETIITVLVEELKYSKLASSPDKSQENSTL